jgi:beta-xylosidase
VNQPPIEGLIRRRTFLTGLTAAATAAAVGRAFGNDPQAAPTSAAPKGAKGGNPVLDGWYADPEAVIFGDTYWIFPTYSAPYDEQVFFDAFSSPDLVNWTKHPRVLEKSAIKWARRAMWAPSVVEKGGRYFFFFGANDIQNDREHGGIGVAVADKPEGPYTDYLGKPLIDKFHNGAQPIDQYCFRDQDGTHYLFYGGWRHCNVAKLNADFTGFEPLPDGSVFKEITPERYVEGPTMFIKDGRYYLMWSEGGWTGPNYSVAYAIGDSPLGPFKRVAKVLQQDASIATGAGHHSVLHVPAKDGKPEEWFAVYHRRPLGKKGANERVTCIDRMEFDEHGRIKPIRITHEGVPARPLE